MWKVSLSHLSHPHTCLLFVPFYGTKSSIKERGGLFEPSFPGSAKTLNPKRGKKCLLTLASEFTLPHFIKGFVTIQMSRVTASFPSAYLLTLSNSSKSLIRHNLSLWKPCCFPPPPSQEDLSMYFANFSFITISSNLPGIDVQLTSFLVSWIFPQSLAKMWWPRFLWHTILIPCQVVWYTQIVLLDARQRRTFFLIAKSFFSGNAQD